MKGESPAIELIKRHAAIDEQIRELKKQKHELHVEITQIEAAHAEANRGPAHLRQAVG